ncbi:MAG: hypothetical protein ACLFN6_07335, partial [Desulfonatronovibrio sp.]
SICGVIRQRIKIRLLIIAPFPCQKKKLLVSGKKTGIFNIRKERLSGWELNTFWSASLFN